MHADNSETEQHVICEFEDSYLIYKIFVLSLFSKYEQLWFIQIQISRGKNTRQYGNTAVLEACGRDFTISYRS